VKTAAVTKAWWTEPKCGLTIGQGGGSLRIGYAALSEGLLDDSVEQAVYA
jgi:hypothetical protein